MESPCVKICTYDPVRRLCSGCGRTLDEIADWANLGEEARVRILAELPQRLSAFKRD